MQEHSKEVSQQERDSSLKSNSEMQQLRLLEQEDVKAILHVLAKDPQESYSAREIYDLKCASIAQEDTGAQSLFRKIISRVFDLGIAVESTRELLDTMADSGLLEASNDCLTHVMPFLHHIPSASGVVSYVEVPLRTYKLSEDAKRLLEL